MSGYRELAPSAELHSVVACRWVRRVPEERHAGSTLVLPDGCVDLIWRDGKVIVAGLDRRARPSPIRPGETILGLRLRPGVAGAVLGIPASEVLDEHPALEDVVDRRARELAARLAETNGERRAFELLEELISGQLKESAPDPLVLAATRRLGFPGSRVDWLADALGISDRQLRRRFHAAVGYGPKTLDRVLRFRRFVSQAPAVAAGDGDLARIAADLGYADQAHMTRDCLRLSGMTPARLASVWSG
jgi:AraC-like DNA-binding protein